MGLDDILAAIKKAKNNEDIKGIYIEGGATVFDSPATAQQVRDALEDFKKSGKWIIAYADQYMQASYYVASVADSLFINKTGMIDFKGMGGKGYYLTGLYEKVGVKYQCTRVGKYKSAVESVTRKDMSDNDREQRLAMYQGIWQHWLKQMAASRKVTAEQLNKVADDSIMVFANIDDYKTAKLIDGAMYPDAIKTIIKGKLGIDEDDDINQVTLSDIQQVMLTGVGAAYVDKPIYGLPTQKAQEFLCDGLGARYESRQNRMLVVSMGTGTSFVKVEGDDIRHIGGMGIG
jgi:protease-4